MGNAYESFLCKEGCDRLEKYLVRRMSTGEKLRPESAIVPCRIGIAEKERSRKQDVIVDVVIFHDLRKAGITDDLSNTVSYSEVKSKISDLVSGGEFNLLESLAERIASLLLKDFAIRRVQVRVRKKKYSKSPLIGVEIVRSQNG